MAMYYYASKISAIACGTRCKQSVLQKSRGQRDRDKFLNQSKQFASMKELNCDNIEISYNEEASSPIKLKSSEVRYNGTTTTDISYKKRDKLSSSSPSSTASIANNDINIECAVLGSGGIMYINGKIVSGPLESLVDILVPKTVHELDQEFIFSFLLSSRLFVRPHELLGKLLSIVPENDELLGPLVGLLGIWTNKFPYDFRDERIMSHVKHIVSRCSNTGLEELVSEMLSALLNRLTELEKHEKDLRACHQTTDQEDSMQYPTSSHFAQVLCRVERKLAKHVGPEEFMQCSNNILLDKQTKMKSDQPTTSNCPPGNQDSKKTCNLETYLDWSARLRLFVCNEILQCNGIRDRSKIVELWSGVAQYCLLVGNYNSATIILESLELPPIARLKVTWSKLSTTCQQLDCMQRHAEGCGDLWSKQAILLNENDKIDDNNSTTVVLSKLSNLTGTSTTSLMRETQHGKIEPITIPSITSKTLAKTTSVTAVPSSSSFSSAGQTTTTTTLNKNVKTKNNDWVVIPVFSDIVKLALSAREDCLQRLPNGHINIIAFDRLAAIVGAFTKHMSEVKSIESDIGQEYQTFCRHMQLSTRLSEPELMMASFDCEEPTQAEKLMYDLT